MGRALRYIAAGTTYHTYSRCINKEKLLLDDLFKDIIIAVINETQDFYEFELHSYEIMPNHLHLVITTTNETDTISKIMQRIKSVIARRYNILVGRSGPFWNERFCDTIVNDFIGLNLYLGYNPVRSGLTNNPRNSKYGSFCYYVTIQCKIKLKITPHKHFLALGNNQYERIKRFLLFEESYQQYLRYRFI